MSDSGNQETGFINPFKGPDAYTELDTLNFFGRDLEKNELIKLLDQNTLTLLYSRSGIGKSSLINAGLIPILKKSKFYFPVYVRLSDKLITDETPTFSSAIVKLIKEEAAKRKSEVTDELSKLSKEEKTITELFYSPEFTQNNDLENIHNNVIPVIIFDQFEEIFSLQFKSDINDLIRDLSYVIEGKIPGVDDKIEEEEITSFDLDYSKNSEDELNTLKNNLQNLKWYRFIFSFRDEYLPHFESLMDRIPSIFKMSGRLNLQTFSIDLAANVIDKISRSSIELNQETCFHLARIISTSDKKFEPGFYFSKSEVQPFMLSLVCKDLYPKIVGKNKDEEIIRAIEKEDSAQIDDIISKYTEDIFSKVRKKTRKFVEEELITDDGKRKLFAIGELKDSLILSEVTDLSTKPELRFLNIVEYSNTPNVEILHDRLLKPLIKSRDIRRKEEEKFILEEKTIKTRNKILRWAVVIILVLLFAASGTLYLILNSYKPFLKDTNKINLERLSSEIHKNSVGALINVAVYLNSVNSIGNMGKFDILPNPVDPLMSTKEDLNKSILDSFRNKPLFISFPDTSKLDFTLSPKCNYKYSIHESEVTADNDTIVEKTHSKTYEFYKLSNDVNPAYSYVGQIDVRKSIKKPASPLSIKYNKPQFSPDDMYFFTPSSDSILIFYLSDNLNGNFKSKDLDNTVKGLLFSRFLRNSELLFFGKGDKKIFTSRFVSNIKSPKDLIEFNLPDNNLLYDAFYNNNDIVYCSQEIINETEGPNIIYYFFDGNSEKPLLQISGSLGQNKSYLGENFFAALYKDTLKVLDLKNLKENFIRTDIAEPYELVNVENNDQLAILNRFGDIYIYNPDNNNSEYKFKFNSDSTTSFLGTTLAFASPPELGNKILISYKSLVRIYNLDKKEKDSSYKQYDFGFLNMRIKYVYFNSDNSVSLIDESGSIVKWYYTKESPENIDQLQSYYEDFTKMYGEQNFIFTTDFLSMDSTSKEINQGNF